MLISTNNNSRLIISDIYIGWYSVPTSLGDILHEMYRHIIYIFTIFLGELEIIFVICPSHTISALFI